MDFALGPNQGAGVPAIYDDEGIMWDLIPFNTSIPVSSSFDGILPGWGTGTFVSASTALVISSSNITLTAQPAWLGPYSYNGTLNTLAASSLQDVTRQVSSDGHVTLNFNNDEQGLEYRLFAYYQNHSTYQEQASPKYVQTVVPQSPVTSFVENGSWVADHYSARGAELIINFWEEYLLGNGTRELIQEVGNYGWEDSMEFGAGVLLWWTPKLLESFEATHGYSLNKYLPLLYVNNTETPGPLASPDKFFIEDSDVSWQIVSDYRQTLTELNQIYLERLSNWAMEALQSQFSAQVVYNLPMDMLANVPAVNAPECESLGFGHVIDAYRQFAGPANLAGKRIISSELGAQRQEVYSQTWPETIWDVKRSVAGSINQFIYHGFPFSGIYPNTSWPGYSTFTYRFSNMHGPRQPSWEYYEDWMNWTARMQWMAQMGVPKIDLAFWLKSTEYFSVPSRYEPNDLVEAGYSYEYLSPDNLFLDSATVVDSVLAPSRQAFKALVLRYNDTLTVGGVQKLVEYAQAGFPVIFSGGIPNNLTGYSEMGNAYVHSALAGISNLTNVHQVPYEGLASSLEKIGVIPRTKVEGDRFWYTYWREAADRKYIFVYNDAWDSELGDGASNASITFETVGIPYQYDAWTGDVTRLAYQQSNGSTTISLLLAGNQSTIVGFHCNELVTPSTHAQHIYESPVNLTDWTLTIEAWTAPANLSDQLHAVKSNYTYNITSIKPWNAISDSLRNTSGRGFYNTKFTWPPASSGAHGALLDLGAIVHTIRVWVNGQQVPPLDPTHAVVNISSYLTEGENKIMVAVSTPLGNALIPVYDDVKTSGTLWLGDRPVEMGYGLVQQVLLIPYN